MHLGAKLASFSEYALISLKVPPDFDSTMRRFESSRPELAVKSLPNSPRWPTGELGFGARRRIVTQDDRQPEGVTQLVLQVLFPGPKIVSVATTSIGKNSHPVGVGICRPAMKLPPVY